MYKEVFNFTSQTLTKSQDCIERSAGPVVVVGGPGTGKSLLLGMLEEKYQSQFSVANLTCIRLENRADLLKSILFTLDQPHQGLSEGDLRFALINYLKPSDRCPNGVLLLVDDAQTLGPGLLDEIRLITNFVRDGQARVRLVLAGTQTLEENLAAPKLQSLNQRVAARCYLTSMRRSETADYIAEHIQRAGGDGRQLFDPQSLKAVHEVSDGCPRLVNQVCEHALIVAATRGANQIVENHVREAWDDVQGIPGDWSAPANQQQDTTELQNDDGWTVIEFGQLDDAEEPKQTGTVYDFENSEGDASTVENAPTETPVSQSNPIAQPEPVAELPTATPEPQPVTAKFRVRPKGAKRTKQPQQEQPAVTSSLAAAATPAPPVAEPTAAAEPTAPPEPVAAAEPTVEEPTVEEIAAANGVKLRQPVEPVDPFEESFAEEEHLQDRFAPVVAHQNHASLDVTSADLEAIKPADEPSLASPQQTSKFRLTSSNEQSQPAVSPPAASPAVQLVETTNQIQTPQPKVHLQPAAPIVNKAPAEPQATAPPSEPAPDRDAGAENNEDIERQAEEILERLRLSTVSHETETATAPEAPTEQSEAVEEQARQLDESQKVLEEILSQKQLLAESRNPTPGPAPPQPTSIEYPITHADPSPELRRDDSEMLIVSRMEQKMESPKSPRPDPIQFPETPVSKGNAQRMDYQKLFDQLRDISND